MWTITEFSAPGAVQQYACDGHPIVGHGRNNETPLTRIVVFPFGYLDVAYHELFENGPFNGIIAFNQQCVLCGPDTRLSVTISEDGGWSIIMNGVVYTGALNPMPVLVGETIEAFREMMTLKIVPYQDPPPPTVPKTDAELQTLGEQYFPGNPYNFDYAMSLYDWTSSSFIRQDLFHQLQYTGSPGGPLDLHTMARVIYGCDYPGYTHVDANFMNQFMMQPASSEEDVYNQLCGVYERVKPLAIAEMKVYENAVLSLAPPTVAEYPQLYRGAMSMSGGYDTGDFAPSMFEFPGNDGPTSEPLYQAFDEALNGTLRPGAIITTKGPWSFSNDLAGAEVWQNGILITLNPPEGATVWPGCADITAFSINPGTFEIDMPPPTRYRIEDYEWITIKDKPVCHFTMTLLGYCVEPM